MLNIECAGLKKALDASNFTIAYYERDDALNSDRKTPDGEKGLVLIVDDHPDSAIVRSLHVRSLGFDVLSASGDDVAKITLELVRRFGAQPPALILLDYNMPYKDGYLLAKELRSIVGAPLNIACITATQMADDRPTEQAAQLKNQFEELGIPVIGSIDFTNATTLIMQRLLAPIPSVQGLAETSPVQ